MAAIPVSSVAILLICTNYVLIQFHWLQYWFSSGWVHHPRSLAFQFSRVIEMSLESQSCQKRIKWANSEPVSLAVLLEMKKFHHEEGLKDKGFSGEGDEWPAPQLTHQAEQTKDCERLKHPPSWPQKRSQLCSSSRNSATASDPLWEDQGVTATVLRVH